MSIKKMATVGLLTVAVLFGGGVSASANNSIVDFLASKNADYSFENRAQVAEEHAILGYTGTAAQNLQLLAILRDGAPTTPPKQASSTPVAKPKAEKVTQPQAAKKATPTEPKGVTFTAEATAYTAYCVGCSGITATGIDLRSNPNQKVIAVDPRVIPLGSKVYVEGYGTAIAGDTGGAIKGNKIDLFMPNRSDALNFGRKHVKVTILK